MLQLLQDSKFKRVLQKITRYALGHEPVNVFCVICNDSDAELAKFSCTDPSWMSLRCAQHTQAFYESYPGKENCCEINYHPDKNYWWRG